MMELLVVGVSIIEILLLIRSTQDEDDAGLVTTLVDGAAKIMQDHDPARPDIIWWGNNQEMMWENGGALHVSRCELVILGHGNSLNEFRASTHFQCPLEYVQVDLCLYDLVVYQAIAGFVPVMRIEEALGSFRHEGDGHVRLAGNLLLVLEVFV